MITSRLQKEQEEQLKISLINFITRVCDDSKSRRDVEIAALPEIIHILFEAFA